MTLHVINCSVLTLTNNYNPSMLNIPNMSNLSLTKNYNQSMLQILNMSNILLIKNIIHRNLSANWTYDSLYLRLSISSSSPKALLNPQTENMRFKINCPILCSRHKHQTAREHQTKVTAQTTKGSWTLDKIHCADNKLFMKLEKKQNCSWTQDNSLRKQQTVHER